MSSISSNKAPEPVGHYPHARRVGELLFLSGVGPRERGTKKIPGVELDANGMIISYDIETQVRSVFQNVKWILEDAGIVGEDRGRDGLPHQHEGRFPDLQPAVEGVLRERPTVSHDLGDQLPAHTDRDRAEGGGDGVISVDQRAARSTSRPISGRP
jgi:hypothetical protein